MRRGGSHAREPAHDPRRACERALGARSARALPGRGVRNVLRPLQDRRLLRPAIEPFHIDRHRRACAALYPLYAARELARRYEPRVYCDRRLIAARLRAVIAAGATVSAR